MATNGIGIGISTNTANDTNGDVKSQQKPDKEQLVLTPDPTKKPRVAVIGIISNGRGQVVAGRRIGPLGGGTLSFPGGHLEFGESIFSCVERETLEESGLVVRGVRTVGVTNDFFVENNLHYITVWAICERVDEEQEPQRLEPQKCEGWSWTDWTDLEQLAAKESTARQLFVPLLNLVREYPELGREIKAGCSPSS